MGRLGSPAGHRRLDGRLATLGGPAGGVDGAATTFAAGAELALDFDFATRSETSPRSTTTTSSCSSSSPTPRPRGARARAMWSPRTRRASWRRGNREGTALLEAMPRAGTYDVTATLEAFPCASPRATPTETTCIPPWSSRPSPRTRRVARARHGCPARARGERASFAHRHPGGLGGERRGEDASANGYDVTVERFAASPRAADARSASRSGQTRGSAQSRHTTRSRTTRRLSSTWTR